MNMNPYQVLGVERNASAEEIKKAYRKLAAQHHPDKGGTTAKFQEVQAAYDTLGDVEKRSQFDNPNPFNSHGHPGFEFNFGSGPDIFSQFFNEHGNPFHNQQQQRKNKDLRVNISVPLESTLKDQKKLIAVTTTHGTPITVNVKIPRGVSSGTTIKYSQMGDNFFNGLPPGDLYVIVTVMRNTRFDIHGLNLVTTLQIDCVEAMIGTQKEIQGIDGSTYLVTIPPGCQYGTNFGLQGKGLYQLNSDHKGDLIVTVTIKIVTPTESQIQALKSIYPNL